MNDFKQLMTTGLKVKRIVNSYLEPGIILMDEKFETFMWAKKTDDHYSVNQEEFLKIRYCIIERLNKNTILFSSTDKKIQIVIKLVSPKVTDYIIKMFQE